MRDDLAPPHLDRIRSALADPERIDPPPHGRQAAVALVLAGKTAELHVCLIRRAEHDRDRWSGHVALPGGRVEADDPSVRAAAVREVGEEVGLRLERSVYLGTLEPSLVSSAGRPTGMSLVPFVFYLGEALQPFAPSDEVAEAFWVPLGHLLDRENAVLRPTPRDGTILQHPAVRYQEHVIWGLTYRVLAAFFERLDLEIARPE